MIIFAGWYKVSDENVINLSNAVSLFHFLRVG